MKKIKARYEGFFRHLILYRKNKGFIVVKMMMIIDKIALVIAIIGTLNWGSVGLFSFDAVAWISGGATTILARIIYVIVALAGLWCISMLFRHDDELVENHA